MRQFSGPAYFNPKLNPRMTMNGVGAGGGAGVNALGGGAASLLKNSTQLSNTNALLNASVRLISFLWRNPFPYVHI